MDSSLLGLFPNMINAVRSRKRRNRSSSQAPEEGSLTAQDSEFQATDFNTGDPPEYSFRPEAGHQHLDGTFRVLFTIRYLAFDNYGVTGIPLMKVRVWHVGISETTLMRDLIGCLDERLAELGLLRDGEPDIVATRRRGPTRFWGRAGPAEIAVTEDNWVDVVKGFRQGQHRALQYIYD